MSKGSKSELTPLMKQYWDIKSLHSDKILFFRMGDFFELFYDDATTAAPLLGITLTQRNKKSEDQTPMCGMPHFSVAGPINKLLALGHKIAICDQVEDPKLAKGLVRRAITRILTPGMVFDPENLDASSANYISSIDDESISFIDTSTGECIYFESDVLTEKMNLIQIMPVVEIVLQDNYFLKNKSEFSDLKALITLNNIENKKSDLPYSAQNLLNYIQTLTNQNMNLLLRPFEKRSFSGRLELSSNTIRHLEIFSTYKGSDVGTLFCTVNKTKTSAGARLLRQNLLFPLKNKSEISNRLNQIEKFRHHLFELKKTREILSQMGDVERRLSKISLPQVNGRDLRAMADSIEAGIAAVETAAKIFKSGINILSLSALVSEIKTTIVEDAPVSVLQGYLIQKGYSAELDELIELTTNVQSLLQAMEAQEKERTGISSLKIRYNNVFGYFIEITNSHKDKVPKNYQRKQTLSNAERFCTDELIELEKKVLSAQKKRNDLEFAIFDQLKNKILNQASLLLTLSKDCSELDFYSSLAWLSLENHFCKPVFSDDKKMQLIESRHPVVEQFQKNKFVANTIELDDSECFLITGPNMAGKSTLMRQIALTVILAQMGSFVPATQAQLPIYDAIFTRIGASDQLTEGLSTFMVEMSETADMLHRATKNSLLILDEIGRGTSTFDGLSLAQSILEHLISQTQAHAFFATHYHELTNLDQVHPKIKNVHMKIHEQNQQIQFLHLLSKGPAGQSYGIQVAQLAGLPMSITERAKSLLSNFEKTPSQSLPGLVSPILSTHLEPQKPIVSASANTKTAKIQSSFFD
jgi:DNA mismatch repair protein MutS